MSTLAAIRPDDWNLPVFFHVAGAMVFVATLLLVALTLGQAWRTGDAESIRLGYRTLLIAVIPSFLVMRVFAEVAASKEKLNGDNVPSWVDYGYISTEPGLLLVIIATVLTGLAARKAREAQAVTADGAPTRVRVATVLVSLLIPVYIVVIWAMTTKPV